MKEGDYVRIISFDTVIFKDTSIPKSFGINDIMPDFTVDNYKTVDTTNWLGAKYTIIKISNYNHYHVRSVDGQYNFIIANYGLRKVSILDINYEK
jgi:hypothetical protein